MTARLLVHPEWLAPLALGLLATLLALACAWTIARRRRRRLGASRAPRGALLRDAALLIALAAVALALAGPRVGQRTVLVPGSGVDAVLLVDVSRSMDAADVAPSRLARAVAGIEQLLARLSPRDRVGLAVFASRGVVVAPLTPDHAALVELAQALDTSLVHPAGSDLVAGVEAAVDAFEAGSDRPRVLVVLSDGEDPERRGALGIGAAIDAEARVVALALGTDRGAQIPDGSDVLRDADGDTVVTRRAADRLERLAAATDGALFGGDASGGFDLAAVADAIRRDAGRSDGAPVERRVAAVRTLPLAALALALLLLELLPRLPRRAPAALVLAGVALALAAAAPLDPETQRLEQRLQVAPRDARARIALGLAHAERGRRAAAERALLAAAIDADEPRLAATAYFDLGVLALEAGDPAAARDAFLDALALDDADREARFNLEWSLEALRREPPAEAPQQHPPPGAPPPEAPPGSSASEAEGPPPLSHEERVRWLERVRDDVARGLRAAAREHAPRGRSSAPRW